MPACSSVLPQALGPFFPIRGPWLPSLPRVTGSPRQQGSVKSLATSTPGAFRTFPGVTRGPWRGGKRVGPRAANATWQKPRATHAAFLPHPARHVPARGHTEGIERDPVPSPFSLACPAGLHQGQGASVFPRECLSGQPAPCPPARPRVQLACLQQGGGVCLRLACPRPLHVRHPATCWVKPPVSPQQPEESLQHAGRTAPCSKPAEDTDLTPRKSQKPFKGLWSRGLSSLPPPSASFPSSHTRWPSCTPE